MFVKFLYICNNDLDLVRYFKVLVQEFNVKIDKGFMMSLYDVFANLMTVEESEVSLLHPSGKHVHEMYTPVNPTFI